MTLSVEVEATSGPARATTITTSRGTVTTPCFMPVGTRGTVRAVETADLEALGAQIVLGNTYHLLFRPGPDVVEAMGGIHGFSDWSGHVLTDSGGYQVFSLAPKVDDDGVTFRSTYDGDEYRLTPEGAVDVQLRLGADIQMVLDECAPLPSPPEVIRTALERTADWAARARTAFLDREVPGRYQFGIVQGGVDPAMRTESAQRTVDVGFDGYAIGGLSVGESRDEMLPALDAAIAELPADRPRYLMGLGDPVGIVESIARGVDLFDCVLPTRFGRHGTILSSEGRYNMKNRRFATDAGPLDPACDCRVCGRYSRAYLRHLFNVNEPTGPRLATLHNLAWILRLTDRARVAVADGTLDALRAEVAAVYE
ncbi:MAG TPA: tRNA guanosine(34) transglycosylase Tgt [Acidimicrobiales bacterium]|nr:tRNA guanosine(34) transglycosylase Tgt [Acidimicrobiales bacterium]